MRRLATTAALLVLVGGLTACRGSDSSADATAQASSLPSSVTSASTASGTGTTATSSTGQTATSTATAALPVGFPLPEGATPVGAPLVSGGVVVADYTVPDGKKAYDSLVEELPGAGWAIGTTSYDDDLGSGTIEAQGHGTQVKLLVLGETLSLSVKTG